MRFLKEPFVPRGNPAPEESVAAFARRRFGEEGAARFFDPLVSGTTGGDPEQLLARYTFPVEVEYERRAGSVLKGRMRAARTARREGQPRSELTPWSCGAGLEALPRHVAASLGSAFRAGIRVTRVTVTAAAAEVGDASGGRYQVDGVVVALPAPVLGQVTIEAPGSDALAGVSSMPHASLVVVATGYRRDQVTHPLDGHGVLAASSERRRILGVVFSSSQFPERAPAGHVLLTVSLGGGRHPAVASLDDTDVMRLVREELGELLGASGEPVTSEIRRWPAALPLAVAGHAERLAGADGIEAANNRLVFAGPWRDGLMLRDVMQGGVAAADRLMQRL
jgi:oxygen-dependent protoporphyrinogen oxidase